MIAPDLPEEARRYEEEAFERLVAEARLMTAIGLHGEDARSPRVQAFLTEALAATEGEDDLRQYILKNWRTGK